MTDSKRVEAVLFASGRYLSEDEIAELAGVSEESVDEHVETVRSRYEEMDSAVTVFEDERGYKLNVSEDFSFVVRRVVSEAELGDALMETLALIAYKAPVLQSDVVEARSARAYNHIHELTERGFVEREREGRTYTLHVTDKFYQYFDVADRAELSEVFEAVQPPDIEVDLDDDGGDEDQERFEEFLSDRLREVEERDESEEEAFLDDIDERLDRISSEVDEIDPDADDVLDDEAESNDED